MPALQRHFKSNTFFETLIEIPFPLLKKKLFPRLSAWRRRGGETEMGAGARHAARGMGGGCQAASASASDQRCGGCCNFFKLFYDPRVIIIIEILLLNANFSGLF